ncbi:glutathione S-transferase family protein [Acinetobacter bereziniae]|jgi:glutathione S-transferase|uniref:glutathione S-transferase family protein n=1 Tax=Acinetobacter bereziniae TaxID=106648 RepID=UPI000C2BAA3D|nr:glutathione S-transferase family protein [Acinetobacter bereziniae]ATZ65525.1 glutathione S-transferase [Acinetobacter bereziniae]MBJ8551363.1 glutathione S-transferase family protein [Acinetobacter bereziniae]MCU4314170.1 glutathione S-transferase family protein [Acinetobacter bereziniae]MDA3441992.1 glutathione S-transferase family protein [Acinetobacter bereziniae]MDM1785193.1 glutathione S-transferase family protein [Acinetobacter bereziniae]
MLELFIGDKNYSTWSMRPWLVIQHFNIPFKERLIPFDHFDMDSQFKQSILKINPTGKVPALVDDGFLIWDSLAICEYLAEKFPEKQLWPQEIKQRARARSMSAEMHSSFTALRSTCDMNIDADLKDIGLKLWQDHPALQQDVYRIAQLWSERPQLDGFLCGESFSIVDAFYAPVVMRFMTYGIPVTDNSQRYIQKILTVPAVQQWIAEAQAEFRFVACEEQYRTLSD